MHAPATAVRPPSANGTPTQVPGPLFNPFAQAQGSLPTLGDVVWWSIPADVEVSLVELESKLEAAGLPVDLVPKLQPRGALSSALKALETSNLIRRITDDANKIAYALVREQVEAQHLELVYEQTETIVYRKETKQLEFQEGQHAAKIRELFDRYRITAQAQHLRQIVREALEKAEPITVRPGLIFVPKQHRAALLALGEFVRQIDARACLGTLGIVDSAETRGTMLRVVREELEAEIALAASELDELLQADGERRKSTLASRLDVFRTLRAKVSGYAELLELASQDLVARLGELETKVKTAL